VIHCFVSSGNSRAATFIALFRIKSDAMDDCAQVRKCSRTNLLDDGIGNTFVSAGAKEGGEMHQTSSRAPNTPTLARAQTDTKV
jgi:hypothetical protein